MIDETFPVARFRVGDRVTWYTSRGMTPGTIIELSDDDAVGADDGKPFYVTSKTADPVFYGRSVRLRCDDGKCSCSPDSSWAGGGWMHAASESQLNPDGDKMFVVVPLF